MKKTLCVLLCLWALFFSSGRAVAGDRLAWSTDLPVYDHVVIVIEENKNVDQILGSPAAPFINHTLKAEGATLSRMYGEEHYSQGNYFWLFSGSNQNVGFHDWVPSAWTNPDYPFTAPNLGSQLIAKGLSFKGYAESLPAIGDTTAKDGTYARKHVPWISFGNEPNGTTAATSSNLRFKDFPTDYNALPAVAIVIPNLIHDMHNGTPPKSIADGDAWLKIHLGRYYRWAKTHNSLLILTFDEDDDVSGYAGLTDPGSDNPVVRNRIVTIFAGARIRPGEYPEGKGVTHVNILRTLEAMYGLERAGAQQPNALKAGIADDALIKDIFVRSSGK